jgi:hypothetical protein
LAEKDFLCEEIDLWRVCPQHVNVAKNGAERAINRGFSGDSQSSGVGCVCGTLTVNRQLREFTIGVFSCPGESDRSVIRIVPGQVGHVRTPS